MERRLDEIVDVMRVPASGDPGVAVLKVDDRPPKREIECDVLVVGGGMGGVAAALAAARRGCRTCLLEETDWLGGQLSAQGVSALDEHEHIEAVRRHRQLLRAARRLARSLSRRTPVPPARDPTSIPGDCWVTRLAFEPARRRAGDARPARSRIVASGRLQIFLRSKTVAVDERRRPDPVAARDRPRRRRDDPLPRRRWSSTRPSSATCCRWPAPSTGSAPNRSPRPARRTPSRTRPRPRCVQSFTYTFAAERRPAGERHVIAEPAQLPALPRRAALLADHRRPRRRDLRRGERLAGVPALRPHARHQGRALDLSPPARGRPRSAAAPRTTSRCSTGPATTTATAASSTGPRPRSRPALQDAKRVSLGFLHWLQTEAPTAGERRGAPEIMLRPDAMGTRRRALQASLHPRVAAHRRPEDDRRAGGLGAVPGRARAAAPFADSVGIGWYPIDIHRAGADDVGLELPDAAVPDSARRAGPGAHRRT